MRKLSNNWLMALAAIMIAVVGLAACSAPVATPAVPPAAPKPDVTPVNLTGAGATFPAPLYTKWFDEYNKLTGVKVNYQPIGSGGGISQITEGTVDFGATDGIMTA